MKRIVLALIIALHLAIAGASDAAEYVRVTLEKDAVAAKDPVSGKILFQDADALQVFEWAMMNHPVTVIGTGLYRIAEPVRIPRAGISLVIDQDAEIRLDIDALPRVRPYAPWIPVIYNQRHDDVTVVNLGTLRGQPKSGGTAILYDGRADGEHGLRGGRIVSTGMQGLHPPVSAIATLVDCAEVEIPMLISDGYRNVPLELEGCKDVRVGLVTAVPRASARPITLLGRNEGTQVRKVVATQPLDQAVLVRNSTGTVVEESILVGDPMAYVKLFHVHEYGPGGGRFTRRPFIPDSEGSKALKETIVNRKVKEWPQSVTVVGFPGSLPRFSVHVELDAVFEDGESERVIDQVYDLELLGGEDFASAPEFLFVSAASGEVTARGGRSGKVRFESADPRETIEWAMANSPITVLEAGTYVVPGTVTIPRDNVSLIISEGAELVQDPAILIDVMPGGRGGYRPLIHNPGHDHVEIINFGTLRAHQGLRGVGIHVDGRKEGELGIDGGLIFATGRIFADDAVWVVDAKNIRIPLLSFKGYGNAPLAIEGCEDMEIGILAALMGSDAFENEALDFNSFAQRVHIGLVIGTTPAEEIVDVNNSRDCVIDEIRVYRSPRDVMPVRVFDHPPEDTRGAVSRASKRPFMRYSGEAVSRREEIVEKVVSAWDKSVAVKPIHATFPSVEIHAGLAAKFEDGGEMRLVDESLTLNLLAK
ncbi:MAG TPA: hypothetical protein PKE12_10475 [Kiritimatiellia bacterium]|nr:hypothetical protein [Kiritimatiellia bacterium]